LNETQFLFNFIQVFKSIRLLLIIWKCCSNLPNSDLLFIMYYSFKQFYSLDYSEHKLWLIMTERVPTDSGSSISVKCKFLIRFFSFILQQFSSIMTFYTYCSNVALTYDFEGFFWQLWLVGWASCTVFGRVGRTSCMIILGSNFLVGQVCSKTLLPGDNFINILHAHFSYESLFKAKL